MLTRVKKILQGGELNGPRQSEREKEYRANDGEDYTQGEPYNSKGKQDQPHQRKQKHQQQRQRPAHH